jgi:hypothetical protein
MINVGVFYDHRNILWSFGIIYGRLVICYIFPVLVCLDQEKSGNPARQKDFFSKKLPP